MTNWYWIQFYFLYSSLTNYNHLYQEQFPYDWWKKTCYRILCNLSFLNKFELNPTPSNLIAHSLARWMTAAFGQGSTPTWRGPKSDQGCLRWDGVLNSKVSVEPTRLKYTDWWPGKTKERTNGEEAEAETANQGHHHTSGDAYPAPVIGGGQWE